MAEPLGISRAYTKKNILTVDDEQGIVDLISAILEDNEYTAIGTTTWTDALDSLNHENPDLVLLDLKMPIIHGTTLLNFILSENFGIPVVVISGFVTEQTSKALLERGVKGIVKKPFEAHSLIEEIKKHVKDGVTAPSPPPTQIDALYNFAATTPSLATPQTNPTLSAPHVLQSPPPKIKTTAPPPLDKPVAHVSINSLVAATPKVSKVGPLGQRPSPVKVLNKMEIRILGVITIVCLMVSIFLGYMQRVIIKAPVAMENLKSGWEQDMKSQIEIQMKQGQQQRLNRHK